MLFKKYNKMKKTDKILIIGKITIIAFVGIYLIGNFTPYFEGEDSFLYGITAKNFAEGKFSISNELLQEYGRDEFTGGNWLKTIDNTAVPVSGIGLSLLAALFYFVAGEYGLFYLSPICAIILLIVTERISSNLFGKYVGFLTLLIMASSNLLIRNTVRLQTEAFFSLLIIIGVFLLIKYLRTKNNYTLLASTSLLTFSATVRIIGFTFFPIELIIILGYFIYNLRTKNNTDPKNSKKIKIKFSKKQIIKTIVIVLIPWMIFFGWWTDYNEKNFDDPFTNYGQQSQLKKYETSPLSLIEFENEDFENIKYYSKYLLPYQIPAIQHSIGENSEILGENSEILGENWLGIVALLAICATIGISFYKKNKKLEVIILIIFILCMLWFYSAITTAERAEKGAPARYMLPAFTMSSMLFSFFIVNIFEANFKIHSVKNKSILRSLKIILISSLVLFFLLAFYFSPPVKSIIDEKYEFKDPRILSDRYPLEMEGLTEDSIIIAKQLDWAIDYGVTPFSIRIGSEISLDSVSLLKEILENGKEVYIFKESTESDEKEMFVKLVNEHNIIFKDFSPTFCKVELNIQGKAINNVDKVCITEPKIKNVDK
jgi:hypothetical protein